ncbi:MAG: PepSY domain-containing protein [Caulobacteraceae bacterium]
MKRIAALVGTLLIVTGLPAASEAQIRQGMGDSRDSLGSGWSQQQDTARDGVRRGRIIPLNQVIEMIRRRTPGRPLDAGMEQYGNQTVYRVRWITDDGRRMDFIVDASTGAILVG